MPPSYLIQGGATHPDRAIWSGFNYGPHAPGHERGHVLTWNEACHIWYTCKLAGDNGFYAVKQVSR